MGLQDKDLLDLPDAPDFCSEPPRYSMAEFIALCEKLLPYWNKERYSKPLPPFIGEAFRFVEDSDQGPGDTP